MSAPLRVGVVGVGMMGADHAERLAARTAGAVLAAVADPDLARAEELAGRLGVAAFGDPLDLIASPEVDAVLLASPGFVHEQQVLACFAAGKPVLCEKPMTMDIESSLRIVEAERALERPLLSVGFMRRFDPEYAQLQGMLAGEAFGPLLVMHQTHRNRSVPNPEFRSEMIVRDSLVHEVDCARFFVGAEIEQIQVIAPRPTSLACEGVADPQIAIFRMANGVVITNEVFVNCQVGYEVRAEAVCERGTAIAGRPQVGLYTTVSDNGAGYWGGQVQDDFRQRFGRAYDLEVQAWVDAAKSGEVVGANSWDGYAATAVCEAGMASLASGQPVAVTLVNPTTLS